MARILVHGAALAALVLSLSVGRASAVDNLVPGTVGVVRPLGFAKLVSRAPSGMPFVLPGVGDDPTVAGATLRIFDTGGAGGDHTYVLPAANWLSLGNPGEFAYRRAVQSDPVKRVHVRGRILRVIVQRQGENWTPPFSGEMAVNLTVGTSSRYCASLGGTTVYNSPQRLRRRLAPPPPACASPSGAFLDGGRAALFD